MNLTQNIDDLEIAAGISEKRLLQAHGHSRSAHCIDCKKLIPIS
jgi:NAD-dependent SIR2 family protein deacetylase